MTAAAITTYQGAIVTHQGVGHHVLFRLFINSTCAIGSFINRQVDVAKGKARYRRGVARQKLDQLSDAKVRTSRSSAK